jgi:hypothetical protein
MFTLSPQPLRPAVTGRGHGCQKPRDRDGGEPMGSGLGGAGGVPDRASGQHTFWIGWALPLGPVLGLARTVLVLLAGPWPA